MHEVVKSSRNRIITLNGITYVNKGFANTFNIENLRSKAPGDIENTVVNLQTVFIM